MNCKATVLRKKLTLRDIKTTPTEPQQNRVVAVDSCFASLVARQHGVTNRIGMFCDPHAMPTALSGVALMSRKETYNSQRLKTWAKP